MFNSLMLSCFFIWSRMSSQIVPTNRGTRYYVSLNNKDVKCNSPGCRTYEIASDSHSSVMTLSLCPSLLAQVEVILNFTHAALWARPLCLCAIEVTFFSLVMEWCDVASEVIENAGAANSAQIKAALLAVPPASWTLCSDSQVAGV